jgi:hypothetical protein
LFLKFCILAHAGKHSFVVTLIHDIALYRVINILIWFMREVQGDKRDLNIPEHLVYHGYTNIPLSRPSPLEYSKIN